MLPATHTYAHTHARSPQVALSLPLQTDTLKRKNEVGEGWGRLGAGYVGRFFNSKSPLCHQGYRKHCSPSIYLPAIIVTPPSLQHTCTHTHTQPGERAPSSTLHWQRLKQKVHPHPWNVIVATSLKSVKGDGGGEEEEEEEEERSRSLNFSFLHFIRAIMPIC